MTEIISVRFKSGGKEYFFNPNGLKVAEGRRPEIVKPRRDFDHDAWEQDVRLRYRYLVKQDYPTLVRNWGKM